jgi:hypothetical protein
MARPGSVVGLFAGAMAVLVLGVIAMATIAWLLGGADGDDPASDGVGATTSVGASSDPGGYTVWERNEDGTPVRWDPCTPIDIVVADDLAPDGWRTDLDAALAILHASTDLQLRVIGEVDEIPTADRSPHQPRRYGDRWAPVLVAWASPGEDLPLRDTDRGLGIPVAVGSDGDRIYVSGQVILNADRDDLDVGDEDRSGSWGATVLHELIHVLGLGHVQAPQELMAVSPGDGPVELGPGDRAGLAAVGTHDGCLEVPPPRPVVVDTPTGGVTHP